MKKLRVIEDLRPEKERENPEYLYACYRLGHFVSDDGLCYSCLRRFEEADDEKEPA